MKNLTVIFLLLIMALAACSPSAPANPIEISQAAVILPGGDAMGGMDMNASLAGYMQIKNNSSEADRLVSVSTDFADAMLHETQMEGDVMKMSPVSGIDVPAGSSVELKTGGYHIMFTNLKKDVKVGDTVNLTLKFEKAGDMTVPVVVESR
jgi:copper(I)-binding protein